MTRTALSALLSHWRRRPGQLAALCLGLMLATALWSGVQAINAEARAAYDRASAVLAPADLARLVRPDGQPIAPEDYAALRRAGALVSPVIEAELNGLTLLGVDPLTAPQGVVPTEIIAAADDFGAFASGDGAIFAAPEDATRAPEGATLSRDLPPGSALADIATVSRLTGETRPSFLIVAPDQPFGLPPVTELTALELRTPDTAADPGELTGSFHLNLTAFGLLSFGVGLFIAHAAIGLAFEQRRPLVRTLRALGVPLSRLMWLLALELMILALIAGAVGIAAGYGIAAALLPGVAGTLRGLYGAPVGAELGFDSVWALAALAITLLGAAVAGAGALWGVARMPILAPALPRAWAMQHGATLRRQALAAVALIILAGLLSIFAANLIAAFGALAALLIGAALALPPFLSWGLARLQPLAKGPFGQWLFADTRQQVPGLSLALMALLLALSANIGVSTMVGSFRTTFTAWIDQRLSAQLYVRVDNSAEAVALEALLTPIADAVLPMTSVERPLAGAPGDIVALRDHDSYRTSWPLLTQTEGAWPALARGDVVFISEQLSRRADLALGDPLTLAPGVTRPVAGIYADYGNPMGQAVMGRADFTAAFPDIVIQGFSVRAAPEAVPELMQALQDFGLTEDDMTDQEAVKALSIRIFDQTFRVTGALSALTLGVAGAALLISFLTLAQMRLPQLAPVWALGVTRSRLARAEVIRALLLAALTWAVALPVGLALAWLLLNRINVEAFGWRLPMETFPADWLRLAALAALAAGLAALWPALRLLRLAPARLLQVFAHER